MNRKNLTTVTGIVAVLIIATLVVVNMTSSTPSGQARASDDQDADNSGKAVSVHVAKPARRPMVRALHMPATLLAGEMADLYAKTSGYISKINVDIGSRVTRGMTLLVIDAPEVNDELRQSEAVLAAKEAKALQAEAMIDISLAEVQRCEAELTLRKITLQRKSQLHEGDGIPEQELDEAKSQLDIADAQAKIALAKVVGSRADVKVAQAEVAMARATVARYTTLVGYLTIRAPFDGIISSRQVDPGAFVRSAAEGVTTPLLSVGRVDFIRMVLEIPESDAPFVRIGTEVEIVVKALGDEAIKAKITRTALALKPNTRTMRTEIDLDNKGGRLAPGMYAQVLVKLETKQAAMMIPSKAIRVRGRELSVLVANGTKVASKPIKIGYDDGIWAEILEGLTGDEQIIVSAGRVLAPGETVRPVPVDLSKSS